MKQGLFFLSLILISWIVSPVASLVAGESECDPPPFDFLKIPEPFRSEFIYWARRLGIEDGLSTFEVLEQRAGDARIIRHHGTLKLVREAISGDPTKIKEHVLIGHEVAFAAQINHLYVVKTVFYETPGVKKGKIEYLNVIDLDKGELYRNAHSKIEHKSAPHNAGELFVMDDTYMFMPRHVLAVGDKAEAFINADTLAGKIRSIKFQELDGLRVLALEYGGKNAKNSGTRYFTYMKGLVPIFDTKGDFQTHTLGTANNKRHLIVNRVQSSSGTRVTQVIEPLPNRRGAKPLIDEYPGDLEVKFDEVKEDNDRFIAFRAQMLRGPRGSSGGMSVNFREEALLVFPHHANRNISQLTKKLYPLSVNNTYGTALILSPREIYRDDHTVVYQSRLGEQFVSTREAGNDEGFYLLHTQDQRLNVEKQQPEKEAKKEKEEGQDPLRELRSHDISFWGSHRLASIDKDPDQWGENLLAARFEPKRGETTNTLMLLDPMSEEFVVIPGYQGAQLKTFNGRRYLFVVGKVGDADSVAFAMYDFASRAFYNVREFDTDAHIRDQLYFPEILDFRDPDLIQMSKIIQAKLPAGTMVKDIDISPVPETSWVTFTLDVAQGAGTGRVQYLWDLSNPRLFLALEEPRDVEVAGEADYVVLAGRSIGRAAQKAMQDDEDELTTTERTTLVFIPRKIPNSNRTFSGTDDNYVPHVVEGVVTHVDFADPSRVEGRGHNDFISGRTSLEFRLDLRTGQGHTIENKIDEPFYTEDDFEVYATRATALSHPKVYFYTPSRNRWQEVKLLNPEKVKKTVEVFFFTQEVEGVEMVPNSMDIDRVTREGNNLFINTKSDEGSGPRTYVYSLNSQKVLFSIPNLVKTVNVGNFRFYIGNATSFNKTHVVVTHRINGKKVDDFDFGRTLIDVDSPECIRADNVKGLVYFQTTTGHTRVFDVRQKYFYGLLPEKIEKIVEPLGKLGTVANRVVFDGLSHQDRLLGRDEFFTQVQRQFPLTFSETGPKNLILLGESGSGRSILLHEYIAQYISGNLTPAPEYKAVFFTLDPTTVTSDTMYRGTFSDKFKNLRVIARKLQAEGYRMVLLLDDFDSFRRDHHGDDEGDLFSQLKTLMNEEVFDVLATSTPNGFEHLTRTGDGLMSKFQSIRIPPMSESVTFDAIKTFLADRYPGQMVMEDALIQSLIQKTNRLHIHRQLPGSVFDILKRIMHTKLEEEGAEFVITRQDVNIALAQQSGVPSMLFDPIEMRQKLPEMDRYLKTRIRNQDAAIDAVMNQALSFAMEVNRSDWPILRALFLGPTGVGKTELARGLTEFLFGGGEAMLKLSGQDFSGSIVDLNQFKRLIVDHIKRNPCNVLLIDEFEKMHREAQNMILALADGEITDAQGRKVSSALTFIIATSNIGAVEAVEAAAGGLGFRNADDAQAITTDMQHRMRDAYVSALERGAVRPEVLNRFDYTVVFNSIDEQMARDIIHDYLSADQTLSTPSIRARFAAQGYDVNFDESAMAYILKTYLDVRYGARRIASRVESEVVSFLAKEQFEGRMERGRAYLLKWSEEQGFHLEEVEEAR